MKQKIIAVCALVLGALVFGICVERSGNADPRSSVAMPVQSLDSNNNILGTQTNPVYTVSGSPADGGTATLEKVAVVNDAGNLIPVSVVGSAVVIGSGSAGAPSSSVVTVQGISGGTAAPSDTVPGEALNSVADGVSPGIQGAVKSSAGTFVSVNACNEGTVTGWLMFFDQGGAAVDGGAVAGLAPAFMGIRTPAGACASLAGVRAFTNGLKWYSSGQAGTLDGGLAPNFTTETFYR